MMGPGRRQTARGLAGLLALGAALAMSPVAEIAAQAQPVAPGAVVFPADLSLQRPEDGIALPGGDLLVADQVHGLRRVRPDGSSTPFGEMTRVGYHHDPAGEHAGANGVSLEPGGTHVLVADIYRGGIYRVALADGRSAKLYQHRYGVNTAVRDSSGAIWFTQSAFNPAENGEAAMWAAIDRPVREGALLRLPMIDGRLALDAREVIGDLQFANGLAIDERRGFLYLAETVGGRVTRYALDTAAGTLGHPETVVENIVPDNIELDVDGMLWVATPLPNTVLVVDPTSKDVRNLLAEPTAERLELQRQWSERGSTAQSRLELLTPAAFAPMPGFITGVILGADDGAVYLSGLGSALLRLQRQPGSTAE